MRKFLLFMGLMLTAGMTGGCGGSDVAAPPAGAPGWTRVSAGLPGRVVVTLAVDGSTLFASGGLSDTYRSYDDGASWVPADAPLGNRAVRSVVALMGTMRRRPSNGARAKHTYKIALTCR